MDISIVDKFISNSITFIQQQIKSKLTQEKILNKINNDLKKLTNDPNISNIINELILICINIFFIIYKKEKMKANLKNSNYNLSIFKYINIFNKIKKLFSHKNIKEIYDLIDTEEFYDIKNIIKEIGEDKINFILANPKTENDYIAFFLIYIFIYIKDYRIQIFNKIEEHILKNTKTKIIQYFTTDITKVDYSTILNSLPKEIKHKANDFYDMLFQITNQNLTDYSIKEKKFILFSKIFIPIVEDFQRIHKSGVMQYNTDNELTEKKEDTIVKKILSDIRIKQDFYNNSQKDNKTLFPNILQDIQGTFYDELLELKILGKLENKLMINNENIELYKLLEVYRKYNFINYINNPNLVLNYESNIPVQAIRASSIEFFDKTKLTSRNIINDFTGDIIAFAIKHPDIPLSQIDKIDNNMKIKSVEEISKLIEKIFLSEKFFEKNKNTLFITKVSKTNINNINDYITKIYENYENIIFSKILNIIDTYKKSFSNIYKFYKELQTFQNNIHKFIKFSKYNSKIKIEIYKHFKDSVKDDYDQKEDYIPGLFNNLINLPTYKQENKKIKKYILDGYDVEKINDIEYDNFISNHTCQHFISWKDLTRDRKNNPNKYNQKLFEFIKKFAILSNNIYICKSCQFQLNLSNDITESFQAGTANILAINLTTERPLEELREYEKYNKSIKNIDKMVEKIASFYNFDNYIGANINSKKNRNEITKEVIDFINIHNNTLRLNNFNKRRQREKNAYIEYGINSDLSNYFLFKLENDIFRFSSDDTDKYKKIKINNIFIVIIFSFMIRLSYNTFINVPSNDKYCNYYFYDKFSDIIFKDIKIIYDFKGTKKNINDVPNLKFYLFMMSCTLSKYGLWFPNEPSTLDAKTIKSIIHTFVDLYNTIITVVMKKKKSYLYEYFAGKILQVFNNVINKPEYLEFIKKKSMAKIKTDTKKNKIKFIKSQVPNIRLNGNIKFNQEKIFLTTNTNINKLISKNLKSNTITIDKNFEKTLIIDYANKLSKIYDKKGNKIKSDLINNIKFKYKEAHEFIKIILAKKSILNIKAYVPKTNKINIENADAKLLQKKISNLLDILKKNLGQILKKNNKQINITEFTYILNFNHLTTPKKTIHIKPEDIRIINKFNKNILTCKINKFYYAFNPNTLNYIGYYEKNKQINYVTNKMKYLIPNYSIYEKLLFMGITYMKHRYTFDEINTLIINRVTNINFFITNFISNINLQKNTNPKLENIELFQKNNNFKYIFSDLIQLQKKMYVKYKFTENKEYSIDELINKSKEINKLYDIFIDNIIEILNMNKNIQTNISEFYIENISLNFNKFNITKYNSAEIKFNLILNSETIIIGDIDTGIGFYGDTDLVEKLTEEEKEKKKNNDIDDQEINDGMDTNQLVDDEEGEQEDMGDEDIQLGVGEI
jgi:hypothetical protein